MTTSTPRRCRQRPAAPVLVPSAPSVSACAWTVYLLRCADGTLYTGCTNDLTRRLSAHGRGRVKYTRGRLPVELIYREPAAGRGPALSREAAIKRLPRTGKLGLLATGAL